MSTDRDVNRIVRSWLDEGVTVLPDRVLDAVLDQVPATPQRRATWWPAWRPGYMNKFLAAGVAVVAVVVAGLFGLRLLGQNVVGPPPVATLSPVPLPEGATSGAGQYAIGFSHAPIDAVMTLPPGWTSGGWYVTADGAAIAFFTPDSLFADACDDVAVPKPTPDLSVDQFATALESQANSDMTRPVSVRLGGVAAVTFLIRPALGAPCDVVRWWQEPCCGDPAYRGAETIPERRADPDVVWLMNVDGQRVAVVAYWDRTQAAVGREIDQIVQSITFVPR